VLRFLTAGESHGQGLVVIVEGLPAGLEITVEEIQAEMARRRLGFGRGPRQRFEVDELTLIGGVRHGRTIGSPVAIEIKNTEWFRSDKWHEEMSPAPGETKEPLTQVRPGHADLAGMQKYGFTDARDVLERASARETAARSTAGSGRTPVHSSCWRTAWWTSMPRPSTVRAPATRAARSSAVSSG